MPFITGTVPAWSDACFSPIQWDTPPKCDGDQGWQVVCSAATDAEGWIYGTAFDQGWCIVRSPATDADGWVYGTAFDHLREDRPGGRASKRVNDRVRSRLWRRVQQQQQVRVVRQSLIHNQLSCLNAVTYELDRTHATTPATESGAGCGSACSSRCEWYGGYWPIACCLAVSPLQ